MANIYNQEGISFNNVIKPYNKFGFEGPFHPFMNNAESDMTLEEYLSTNRSTANSGEYFTTNAIDIHWGGANINNTQVDTTAQLLKIIADLQTKVKQLESAFSTLAQNVGTLVTITNE